jgi:hypothetical protein
MDRTLPCEGRNAGSIPAESTTMFDSEAKKIPIIDGDLLCFI